MTRFDADLHRLATRLAAMVAAPALTAAATDTDTVERARRILRHCCRRMLGDLVPTGEGKADGQPRLADLALNPVGVLQAQLDRDPQPLKPRPGGRVAPHITASANDQWKRLADAAEVVSHEWASSDPASRPTGDRVWFRVADVAALAEAAAALDRQLADAGAPSRGGTLRECAEIGLAAEHARRFATNGPLPQPEPLRPAPHRLTPVPVRTLADTPAALSNLATLVTTAGHLRPDMVGALVAAHARTLDTLATALASTSPPAHRVGRRRIAEALRGHGQALSTVRIACRTLKSIDLDDPRPADQMREIRVAFRQLAERPRLAGHLDAQKALLAALRPAFTFTLAIDTAAGAHIRSGRWHMPANGQRLRWRNVSDDHPINDALELAVAHARGLINQLPTPRPTGAPYQSPHEILASTVLRSRPQRPPGQAITATPA